LLITHSCPVFFAPLPHTQIRDDGPNILRAECGWGGEQGQSGWDKIKLCITAYLGFQMIQWDIRPDQLSLTSFADLDSLFLWFSCLKHCRQLQPQQLQQTIQLCSKILRWLGHKQKGEWVSLLGSQMAKVVARHKGAKLPSDLALPQLRKGVEFLQWQAQWQSRVLHQCQTELRQMGGRLQWPNILDLRDCSMLGCLIGETGAPRAKAIITLKAPQHSTGPCSICNQPGCSGNRLELDSSTGQHTMAVPHHKNEWRGKLGTQLQVLNPTVNQLLSLYCTYARPVLAAKAASGSKQGPSPQMLFLTNTGCEYEGPTLCNWWEELKGQLPGLPGHMQLKNVTLKHFRSVSIDYYIVLCSSKQPPKQN